MKQWLVRRAVLALSPVTALALVFGACSSEPSTSPPATSTEPDAAATQPGSKGEEVITNATAVERLARLSNQFVHIPPALKAVAPPKRPPGTLAPKLQPAEKPFEPRPILGNGDAARFLRRGDRLRAEVP